MQDKNRVVGLDGTPHVGPRIPVTDFWFAQVDVRLGRIEKMVKRLEWQIWLIVCGAAGLLFLEIMQLLRAA
jgi:hypothetical protein